MVSACQPKGIESSDMTVAVSENHSTIVAVRSLWTRLRTRSIATADIEAAAKAASTPSNSALPMPAGDAKRVSLGQEMISTPINPTTTADHR